MERELLISVDPIDELELVRNREPGGKAGAAVYFSGIVRDTETNQTILALEYEAFIPMAEHQFRLIFDEIERRWPIFSIRLIHRIGHVPVGECSLWVEVRAGHRAEAFAACQHLIDQMKKVVPIWKKAV